MFSTYKGTPLLAVVPVDLVSWCECVLGGGVLTAPMRTWFVKHVMKSTAWRSRQMKDHAL